MPNRYFQHRNLAWPAVFGVLFAMTASGYGQQWCEGTGCPSPQPVPEMSPGWSLYWHDPCRCVDDPCGFPTCPVSGPPTWYAMTELMPMFRDQLRGGDFQVDGTTGENILRESSLRTEFDAGARVLFGLSLGDWYRLEGSYFGSYCWSDSAAVWNTDANSEGGVGNLFSPFSEFGDPAGLIGVDFNSFASIRLRSEMDNVELNLRRRICIPPIGYPWGGRPLCRPGSAACRLWRAESSFLVGIRYMRIEEQFEYLTQSDVPAGGSDNLVDIATDNQMIGAQVGWLSQILVPRRSWFDIEIKGGIFQNDLSLNSVYANTDAAGNVLAGFTDRDDKDGTAWVTDLSVVLNHQFSQSMTLRLGYNAIWVWDVALASQNVGRDINRLSLGPVYARNDGDVVYHGPSLGLVWAR